MKKVSLILLLMLAVVSVCFAKETSPRGAVKADKINYYLVVDRGRTYSVKDFCELIGKEVHLLSKRVLDEGKTIVYSDITANLEDLDKTGVTLLVQTENYCWWENYKKIPYEHILYFEVVEKKGE